jgi:hypothetical protein
VRAAGTRRQKHAGRRNHAALKLGAESGPFFGFADFAIS